MSVGEALRTVPASVAKTYGTPLGTLFRTRDDAAAAWADCSGPVTRCFSWAHCSGPVTTLLQFGHTVQDP